jgi:predicted TIM-barrel fold metal-dependent hydrolase
MRADDLILISVDDHICEPRDMFEAHVPAAYKSQAPRVVEDENGREQWWYGDLPGRNLGLNAVAGKPKEFFNVDAARYDEMRPGCYDVDARVADMNAGGQLAGLNFPNWTGFAGQVLHNGPDHKVNDIMIKAYNDWHVDEWCGAHPDRFIPCGILPLYDVKAAASEVHRLAAKGVHAVTFSENPEALKLASIHSDYWDPLYQACVDSETVLCCHLGSSSRNPKVSSDAPVSVPVTVAGVPSMVTFAELLWADFFKRFPTLRFSITEGDIGWMPYMVWRAEHVHDRHSGWTGHDFGGVSGPRDRFRNNIIGCFIKEPIGVRLIDEFNIDNVCWESDYPHSDGTWPDSPELFIQAAAGLSDEQIAKISHENAIQHYKFDPFAHRPKEACTAAALRQESPDVDVVTHVGRRASADDAAASLRAATAWDRRVKSAAVE